MELSNLSIRVSRDDFANAVAWVAHSLPVRPTVPVLAGIMLTADKDGLTISGFDFEVSTDVNVPAEVINDGRVLVSGKLLADITRLLPQQPVNVEVDGAKALITCGSAKFSLPTMPVEDYPELPELPENTGSIPSDIFSEAISQVAVAAGRDDMLPMLTGIRAEIEGTTIVVAATDRFRLAIRRFEWDPHTEANKGEILIPAKVLSDIAKGIASTSSEPIQLALGSTNDALASAKLLGITGSGKQTTTRLLDAQFPPFRSLLPQQHKSVALVSIAPLIESIKRVALVAERGAQVRMQFTESQLILSAGGDDAGKAEETLPVEFRGDPINIAFNPAYLVDGLNAMHSESVMFGFTLPNRSAVLVPAENLPEANEEGTFDAPDTEYLYLLMPVRLPG